MTTRWTVALTGLLISAIGCVFLYAYWSHAGKAAEGLTRCAVYVSLVAIAWVVGLRLFEEQRAAALAGPGDRPGHASTSPPSPSLVRAIRSAVLQQAATLLLTALMLDGGRMFRVSCVAVLGHWAATLLVIARRARSPRPLDLALIRYGFWPLSILIMNAAPLISRLGPPS